MSNDIEKFRSPTAPGGQVGEHRHLGLVVWLAETARPLAPVAVPAIESSLDPSAARLGTNNDQSHLWRPAAGNAHPLYRRRRHCRSRHVGTFVAGCAQL